MTDYRLSLAGDLDKLRTSAKTCTECPLYEHATQTVFGEGPPKAPVMLVGEQPGDKEDLAGHPFVGPAGRLLDQALEDAGIDRSLTYVTNAVKHFKWKPRGKVRLHQKPSGADVKACKPWLEAEVLTVDPRIMVLLGATAAQSIFGPAFRVTKDRGKFLDLPQGRVAMATVHPSSILRAPDEATRMDALAGFVADLRLVGDRLNA